MNKQLLRKADTFEMKEVEESTTVQDKSEYLLIGPGCRRNLLHYETVREIYQICERSFANFRTREQVFNGAALNDELQDLNLEILQIKILLLINQLHNMNGV